MSQTLDSPFQQVTDLLGGSRVLHHHLESQLDAHEMLLEGLPGTALKHLVDTLSILQTPGTLEKAIGMSIRTFQRRKDAPLKKLSQEQSGRAWKFAEILAKATTVFGTQDAAEQWMVRPAMAWTGSARSTCWPRRRGSRWWKCSWNGFGTASIRDALPPPLGRRRSSLGAWIWQSSGIRGIAAKARIVPADAGTASASGRSTARSTRRRRSWRLRSTRDLPCWIPCRTC